MVILRLPILSAHINILPIRRHNRIHAQRILQPYKALQIPSTGRSRHSRIVVRRISNRDCVAAARLMLLGLLAIHHALQLLDIRIKLCPRCRLLGCLLDLKLGELFEAIIDQLHLARPHQPLNLQLINLHPQFVYLQDIDIVDRKQRHSIIVLILVLFQLF